MNPHAKYLQAELAHIRKRLVVAINKNSPNRSYLIGVIDGMVSVMSVIGIQSTPAKKANAKLDK